VAATLVGLGVISLALIWSSFGPTGTQNRSMAVAVTVICWAMAALWLRRRWPSMAQSQVCVITGTVLIAVSCLAVSDPVAGLFGATAFSLVAGYTAFFHSVRLLATCWMVAVVTLAVLVVETAGYELDFALCAALLVVLIVGFVSFAGRVTIWMIDADIFHHHLEPLTGLVNRDGFTEKAATLMGSSSRGDDRYLVIGVISLDSFSLLKTLAGAAGAERARIDIARRLRETARRDAVLAHPSEHEYFVADVFKSSDASALIVRIHGTVKSAPAKLTASIGVVCVSLRRVVGHPAHDVLDELLTVATHAIYDARRGGGNTTAYVHEPPLTTLIDPDDGAGSDVGPCH
jgi:GGDEF domain-containing protein